MNSKINDNTFKNCGSSHYYEEVDLDNMKKDNSYY